MKNLCHCHPMYTYMCSGHYLREGGYVFVICLSVSNFAQKLPNGFA